MSKTKSEAPILHQKFNAICLEQKHMLGIIKSFKNLYLPFSMTYTHSLIKAYMLRSKLASYPLRSFLACVSFFFDSAEPHSLLQHAKLI